MGSTPEEKVSTQSQTTQLSSTSTSTSTSTFTKSDKMNIKNHSNVDVLEAQSIQLGLDDPRAMPGITSEKEISRRHGPINIGDNDVYENAHFMIPHHYRDTIGSILIPHGLILDRVAKLAQDIHEDYGNETIHLVCVLKGGSAFFQDLMVALRKISSFNSTRETVPFTFDFIRVKSYENMDSTGTIKISGADPAKLKGKNVLLIEDIIDTGNTMSKLIPTLINQWGVTNLKVACLLEKRTIRSCGFKADYCGFTIPDKFVIGYCLDYNDIYRDMEHICVINETGIQKYAA